MKEGSLVSKDQVYQGPFKNDMPHGKGKLSTSKGTYEGEFKEGLKLDGVFLIWADNGKVSYERWI